MNIQSFDARGEYKPPTQMNEEDIESKPNQASSSKGTTVEASYKTYSQFTQIDNKREQQTESKANSKIERKTTWLTTSSASNKSDDSSNHSSYQNKQDNGGICFDGIKYGLMGALNLYMKDNFTSYIVRGIQARNPNVGVVQILANPTVQKCKQILNRLRFECFLFTFVGLIFLITECIISIQQWPSENAMVIILQISHLLVSIGMIWTSHSASRYFLPEKARISMGLAIILLMMIIGVIVAKSDQTQGLPNSISVLLLIQFLTSGLLYHIYRQIYIIYKIFI